jgi:hypothetical protein
MKKEIRHTVRTLACQFNGDTRYKVLIRKKVVPPALALLRMARSEGLSVRQPQPWEPGARTGPGRWMRIAKTIKVCRVPSLSHRMIERRKN